MGDFVGGVRHRVSQTEPEWAGRRVHISHVRHHVGILKIQHMNIHPLHVPSLSSLGLRTKLGFVRLSVSQLRASGFSYTSLRTANVSLYKHSGYILHSAPDQPSTRRLYCSLSLATASKQSLFCSKNLVMAQRRARSTEQEEQRMNGNGFANNHTQDHDLHNHSHSHSHSIFGHSHSHNGEDGNGHSHGAEHIVAALQGDKRALLTRPYLYIAHSPAA